MLHLVIVIAQNVRLPREMSQSKENILSPSRYILSNDKYL